MFFLLIFPVNTPCAREETNNRAQTNIGRFIKNIYIFFYEKFRAFTLVNRAFLLERQNKSATRERAQRGRGMGKGRTRGETIQRRVERRRDAKVASSVDAESGTV